MLVDWSDVTKQTAGDAGQSFRSIMLTYFGANADVSKELPKMADQIYAVASALGVDAGGLAKALADGGACVCSNIWKPRGIN